MVQARNVEEFIERQRVAVASNPECGTSHYNLAIGLMGQKRYDEAEKELHAAVDCSPNLAEAYVMLGGICLHRGDMEGCLKYNQHAVHSRAGFAEGYGNIGFVYLQMGEIDKAIPALEKAVKWNPKFIQAFATLANAYLMKGMLTESIEANLRVIQLEPNFPIVYNNLGLAYLEKGEHDMAVQNFDKAVELGYEVAPEILKEIEKYRKG